MLSKTKNISKRAYESVCGSLKKPNILSLSADEISTHEAYLVINELTKHYRKKSLKTEKIKVLG